MKINEKIFFEAMAYIDERYAYGSCMDKNMLCKIDTYTGNCEFVAFFPDEDLKTERLHMKAVKVGDNIMFSPAKANNICVYNYNDDSIRNIMLYENLGKNINYNESLKCAEIVQYKESIYMFPATGNVIIKYDEKLQEFTSIPLATSRKYNFRKDGLRRKNELYLTSTNSNLVMRFDFITDSVKLYEVGEKNKGSWSMVDDGKYLWLVPYAEGSVVKWDPETGEIMEYDNFPLGFAFFKKMFIKGVFNEGKVYAIPSGANMVISIDCKTGNMIKIQDFDMGKGMLAYLGTYKQNIFLMKCPSWDKWVRYENNDMLLWDGVNYSIKEVNPYTLINVTEYVHCYIQETNVEIKEQEIKLSDFLKYIVEYI